MKKKLILITFFVVVLALGKNLNPFDKSMFDFHDETQAARVQQFTLNLQTLHIPPRMAPDFSFAMGYPVFNFYAPTAYFITSAINLIGFDVAAALKLSFLVAILTAATGVYFFLSQFFDYENALIGAALYVSSLYVAVDIFVRGNLSEVWFMALVPWALYSVTNKHHLKNPLSYVTTVVVIAFTLISHNLLSLLFLPVLVAYIITQKKHFVMNMMAVVLAVCLGMFFFLPFFSESSLTYASQVATSTHYADHFLCPLQLWQSPWGFAGSAPGCDSDGISFKVGKPQLIMAVLGLFYLFMTPYLTGKKKNLPTAWFFAAVAAGSLFLTTYSSQFLWDLFAPAASVIQFPWRFVALSLIGIAYLAAFFTQQIRPFIYKPVVVTAVAVLVLLCVSKYFYKPGMDVGTYKKKYLSRAYIAELVAFRISEYLPRTANYDRWKDAVLSNYDGPAAATGEATFATVANSGFEKKLKMTTRGTVALNVHYFPYWHITINDKIYVPASFDSLGRPRINAKPTDTIRALYQQTAVEQIGNGITVLGLCILTAVALYKPLWKKMSSLNT